MNKNLVGTDLNQETDQDRLHDHVKGHVQGMMNNNHEVELGKDQNREMTGLGGDKMPLDRETGMSETDLNQEIDQ